jgi:uncharacterized membrane protein YjgN (DUF898 family)
VVNLYLTFLAESRGGPLASFEGSIGRIVSLTPHQATFNGSGGALFSIYLRNLLLTLVTLGIYFLWGKNRLRTYVVSQCEFEGDRFAWHGTGKELFIGFLKVFAVLAPVLFLIYVAPVVWKGVTSELLSQAAAFVVYLFLVPLAIVGARRYRLSRLSWRGIRFSFRGRVRDFLKLFIRGAILTGLTFGLYAPFFQTQARKFFSENTYFGNARFAFDGKGRDLFGRLLLSLLLAGAAVGVAAFSIGVSIVQLRFSRGAGQEAINQALVRALPVVVVAVLVAIVAGFWYLAYRQRYYWSHTSFQTARFRSTVTAAKLLWLGVSNLLLVGITLGLAIPWVIVRNVRFSMANITLIGSLDLASIVQEAQKVGATAESLADMMNIDFAGFDLPL